MGPDHEVRRRLLRRLNDRSNIDAIAPPESVVLSQVLLASQVAVKGPDKLSGERTAIGVPHLALHDPFLHRVFPLGEFDQNSVSPAATSTRRCPRALNNACLDTP